MRHTLITIAVGIELLGIGLVGTGIGIEVGMKADLGFTFISVGSCVIAAGSLIFAKFFRR